MFLKICKDEYIKKQASRTCWPDWISDSDLELPEHSLALDRLDWMENAMAYFYNDTSLPFIGKGDSHLLQHIPTTKVDAEHIPNTRLGNQGK